MLVKDIMIKEGLVTISPMATIRDAIHLMKEKDVKSLIVEKNRPEDAYGILTYKSILSSIVAEEGDIDLVNVYDIYAKPAIQISEQMDIKYAAQMMVRNSIKRILVIDNNELEGIVTMSDIIGFLIEQVVEEA